MLTRSALGLLTTTLLLLLAGLPTGNLFLVTLALIPLLVLMLAGAAAQRVQVKGRLLLPDRAVRVGDVVPVTVEYEVHGGSGLLELHQAVPGVFTLEDGNNIHVLPKRPGKVRGRFTFRVRCTRRGHHAFPPTDWEIVPVGGLGAARRGTFGAERPLDVRPAVVSLRRSARVRGKANRFLPDNDDAKLGIATTEFRDIRQYVRGDPPKTVNWKATARHASRTAVRAPSAGEGVRRHIVPLVNEYEHEGRKNVWVFLDCAPYMRVGTSAENLFEVAVGTAVRIVQHFSDRGYRVGLTLFNQAQPVHLHPDSGKRQVQRVHELLAGAEPGSVRGELPRAVEEVRRFLLMGRSLVFVITRGELADGTIEAGLRRLRNLTASRNRRPPVLVVSPDPLPLLPDQHVGTQVARLIERHRQEERLASLRRIGITILRWDPKTTRFEAVLQRSVGDR